MCSEEALKNPACLHEAKKMKTHLCPMQHSSTEGTVRGKKREKSAPKKSWGLAFTCNTSFDALCLRKEDKNQHFDNSIQKGINSHFKNKWEDFTVQAQSWSATTLELCCRINTGPFLFPPLCSCLKSCHFREDTADRTANRLEDMI